MLIPHNYFFSKTISAARTRASARNELANVSRTVTKNRKSKKDLSQKQDRATSSQYSYATQYRQRIPRVTAFCGDFLIFGVVYLVNAYIRIINS